MNDVRDDRQALGSCIRLMREELGWSIEALARQTSTTAKYVRALEESDYDVFEAQVYAQGVLKKMVSVMAPERLAEFSGALREAWGAPEQDASGNVFASRARARAMYVTPARVGIGFAVVALGTVVFFSGIRLIRFSAPPRLIVDEPQDQAAVQEPTAEIKGRTEQESRLTVNGRELTLDKHGDFQERIELQPGVNRLNFLSENRFGKKSEVVRYIVVE